ncbi:response regulator transcription factor [Pararhodospirillum photometricum]|nr:response regulator [Pararhodospirillum photometricum]
MDQAIVDFASIKTLVVDDEPFSLSIVVRILRDLRFSAILDAPNGQKALDLYEEGKAPDVSIIDFNMPGLNGLQVLKAVRTGRTRLPRDHRILMLTGNADFGLVQAAIALDVDSFIAKPASKMILSARLEKVLAEPPELKPVEEYEAVDIEAVNRRFLGHDPLGTPRTAAPVEDKADYQIRRVALEALQPGVLVARNILSPSGDLLIRRGTALTERFIRRLKELQDVLNLQSLEILVPAKKEPR